MLRKRKARAELDRLTRQIVRQVRANPIVDGERLATLGLSRPSRNRRPLPPPARAPSLWVAALGRGRAEVRVNDPAAPHRKAKPPGVGVVTVLTACGDDCPSDRAAWRSAGSCGRTRFEVALPADLPPGARVWFVAYWESPTAAPGPTTAAACVRVPFDDRPAFKSAA